LKAGIRPTIQARLDKIVEPALRLLSQRNEIIEVVDEIVVAGVKWLVIIDPMEHAEMIADWCGSQSSQGAVLEQEIV
jgi:hypothetical protein